MYPNYLKDEKIKLSDITAHIITAEVKIENISLDDLLTDYAYPLRADIAIKTSEEEAYNKILIVYSPKRKCVILNNNCLVSDLAKSFPKCWQQINLTTCITEKVNINELIKFIDDNY